MTLDDVYGSDRDRAFPNCALEQEMAREIPVLEWDDADETEDALEISRLVSGYRFED